MYFPVWLQLYGLFCSLLGYFLFILSSDINAPVVKTIISLLDVENKNEVLKFLGISMGGVLVGLQAFMSYRRAKAMEDTVENTEKGMRQERLKNAIEHLGHASDSVRLGGAYELFHLAQDTKEVKQRQSILDILCAHVRQTTSESKYREEHKSKPSEEIQSLLTLLFVQKHDVFKSLQINLQGCWLNGVELSKASLEKAVLNGAHLQKAILNGAWLRGVWLIEAQLQGARLIQAQLQAANLVKAHLQRADLSNAYLQESILNDAFLTGADLTGTHLQETGLNGTYLQGAYLIGTQMQMASLAGAHLQGAFLHMTKMQGVILLNTQMQGACLRSVQLHDAEFSSLQNLPHDTKNLHQKINPEPAHLQGVRYYGDEVSGDFAQRMRDGIGKENDLSGVIFTGGVSREGINSIVKGLSEKGAKQLKGILTSHIGQPVSHKLPEDSGANTEPYTEEEAEQWITDYEEAMSEVPNEDEN